MLERARLTIRQHHTSQTQHDLRSRSVAIQFKHPSTPPGDLIESQSVYYVFILPGETTDVNSGEYLK